MSIEFDELAKQRENPPEEATSKADNFLCCRSVVGLESIKKSVLFCFFLNCFAIIYEQRNEEGRTKLFLQALKVKWIWVV